MKSFTIRPYLAELIGTFLLAFGVGASIVIAGFGIPTIIVAGLILGTAVYTIGAISGAHINPSVTLGLWSVGKIKSQQAVFYIIAQLIGGYVAMLLLSYMLKSPELVAVDSVKVAIAEMLGAFVLSWGVSSVVQGKVDSAASGITIGSSLSIGIIVASTASLGVLNPAVALAIGAWSPVYFLAPLVGGIAAAQLYRWMIRK